MAQATERTGKSRVAGHVALGLLLVLVTMFVGIVLCPAPVRLAGWTFIGPSSGYSSIMIVQAAPAPTHAYFWNVDRANVILSDPRGGRPELTFENRKVWSCLAAVLISP